MFLKVVTRAADSTEGKMKKNTVLLTLCVRKMSSIVATFLVITTLVSFLGMFLIKKYGDSSFQLNLLFIIMLVYLVITVFDILIVAKIEPSFSGFIRAVLAVAFVFVTFIAFYHGTISGSLVFQQIMK